MAARLECLSGFLLLGSKIAEAPKTSPLVNSFNFGQARGKQTVRELVEIILGIWPPGNGFIHGSRECP